MNRDTEQMLFVIATIVAIFAVFIIYDMVHSTAGKAEPRPLPAAAVLKYCAGDADCVGVSCSCCTYADVINAMYEDAWYENNCASGRPDCRMLGCPVRAVRCEGNQCDVWS